MSNNTQDDFHLTAVDDDDDDEIQSVLQAIQVRKARQQKMKKHIRDKAYKSQNGIKEITASKEVDRVKTEAAIKLSTLRKDLLELKNSLREELERESHEQDTNSDIAQAVRELNDSSAKALEQCRVETLRISKKISQAKALTSREAKRSKNESVVRALQELNQEVTRSQNSLRGIIMGS